jgi:nucleoside-diphosphate-sugar epimerase
MLVIDNPYLNGIVIRPGCVYGGQGDMTNDLFDSVINKNSVNVIGDGSNRWPMVHIDDLSHAYLLAAEKDLSNTTFNIVEETSASINEIIAGIKRLSNDRVELNFIPLEKAIYNMGNFAEALAINQKFDTSFAKNTLGWLPKHKGFLNDLEILYSSWKAYQNQNNKNL